MNLVNELENDLALAFLVEKKHSEKINSEDIVALMNRLREILQPLSNEDENINERAFSTEQTENVLSH